MTSKVFSCSYFLTDEWSNLDLFIIFNSSSIILFGFVSFRGVQPANLNFLFITGFDYEITFYYVVNWFVSSNLRFGLWSNTREITYAMHISNEYWNYRGKGRRLRLGYAFISSFLICHSKSTVVNSWPWKY